MTRPLPLRLYGALSRILAPIAYKRTRKRLTAGGMPDDRIPERLGRATRPRPDGKLIWFHGASVGESLSILPLVDRFVPGTQVLVTTGTATSAKLLDKRLPAGAVHQFAPLDSAAAVTRFLDHWRPDAAVFVESEIWPNLLAASHARGIPLALINARMSLRSLERWAQTPTTAAAIFGLFDLIVAQDARTRDGLARLVPDPSRVSLGGNMKPAAAPLPHDADALARWRETLGARPVWVASSTHEGEDAPVLDAHRAVLAAHPETLLILAPRHPDRGLAIVKLCRDGGLATAHLGAGEAATNETQVLVADTMGDLGRWYRLAPIVFHAGSFGAAGGHNPWEAIRLGAALLHGPNVPNAADDYGTLDASGAARAVADGAALGTAVSALLSDAAALNAMREAARSAAHGADDLVAHIAESLHGLLEHRP